MRTTYGRISLGAALLVVTAIVVSCATLTRAPSEVAGARLFTFPGGLEHGAGQDHDALLPWPGLLGVPDKQ